MAATSQQLSDWEGLMWRLETDPFLSANIGNVSVLDRPIDVDVLRRRMAWAVASIPRLRQRIRPMPYNLGAPAWVDDVDFDLARHVRRVRLAAPGDDRTLAALAAAIAAEPFDRDHPLWELVVVDAMVDGRGALIQKFHHALADGEGAIVMALSFVDAEREVPEREPPTSEEIPELVPPPPPPSVRDLLVALASRSTDVPKAILREMGASMTDPSRFITNSGKAAESFASLVAQLSEGGPSYSPLWKARSNDRHGEFLTVPFAPVRAAANELGGTVNMALLTVAAAASGDYHRELGTPVERLRAAMAISTRTSVEQTNAFTLARCTVPTGVMTVRERFARVVDLTTHARRTATTTTLDQIARVATALPTPVVNFVVRQQASSVDFATSNVRFAPAPCFIAGARIVHNYALGPLVGVAYNLTMVSYTGQLDMGIHIDTAAIADPALLRSALAARFEEFAALAPRN
ncbi:MAG: wax ester/triacylglycerol synthase domain-containing protein [Acidimicrobiia bacterium]